MIKYTVASTDIDTYGKELFSLNEAYSQPFEPTFESRLSEPNQLSFMLSPFTDKDKWDKLVNSNYIGLRMEFDGVTMFFIKDRQPQYVRENGLTRLGFVSSSFKLRYEQPQKQFQVYTGSSASLLSQLSSTVTFNLISADKTLEGYDIGLQPNLDTVNDICKRNGWKWRDIGIVNEGTDDDPVWKTIVEIGDFQDIENKYPITSESHLRTRVIDQNSLKPSLSDQEITITQIKRHYSGDAFAYVQMAANVNTGMNITTLVSFDADDVNADYIQPGYPIVGIEDVDGNTLYYIKDEIGLAEGIPADRFATRTFEGSSNSILDGVYKINVEILKKQMYQDGVTFLKNKNNVITNTYGFNFTSIILAGTKAHIRYSESYKDHDGKYMIINNIDEQVPLDDITIEIAEL